MGPAEAGRDGALHLRLSSAGGEDADAIGSRDAAAQMPFVEDLYIVTGYGCWHRWRQTLPVASRDKARRQVLTAMHGAVPTGTVLSWRFGRGSKDNRRHTSAISIRHGSRTGSISRTACAPSAGTIPRAAMCARAGRALSRALPCAPARTSSCAPSRIPCVGLIPRAAVYAPRGPYSACWHVCPRWFYPRGRCCMIAGRT